MKKERKSRIIFAELAMSGVFHVGVNVGLIRVMRQVQPDAEVVFYGEEGHLSSCWKSSKHLPVTWKLFPFFPKSRLRTLIPRDLLGCVYALWILFRTKKSDTVFLTNLLPMTHGLVWLINGLLRRALFICLHGQLEAFLPDSALRGTRHYFRLQRPLFRWDRRTHYVVLGEPVYREIGFVFGKRARVIVIDHPYDYTGVSKGVTSIALPLRFGQIGSGNTGKGTHRLFVLAQLLQAEIEAGRVEIVLVGGLDPALRAMDNGWVKWSPEPLSPSTFTQGVGALHYALFLRDTQMGRSVPSGSFFDAVKYEKPFLSLNNGFIAHYHRLFPESGIMCVSIQSMADEILRLVREAEEGDSHYSKRKSALKALKEALSLDRIAESFQQQMRS